MFYLNDRLVLENSSLRDRVSKLFDELASNEELSRTFVHNPALVLSARLLPSDYANTISKTSIDNANALLHSILSNPKFMEWLAGYQKELEEYYEKNHDLPDRQKIRMDLAKGLIEAGDAVILSHLLNNDGQEMCSVTARPPPPPPPPMSTNILLMNTQLTVLLFSTAIIFTVIVGMVFLGKAFDTKLDMVKISSNELRSLSEEIIRFSRDKSKE